MRPEEWNKIVVQQMIESVERNGLPAQANFFADQVINHGMTVDRGSIRSLLQDISTIFPDVSFETTNIIAERDWVVARCLVSGTHRGVGQHPFVHEGLLAGVAPTGKEVRVQHIHMFRLKDGLIVEHWANRDDVGMMRQLGLLPPIASPERR